MDIVTVDYETFWSATHDIKKCGGPIRYVLHPDTEVQSCAVKVNDKETEVFFGDEIRKRFSEIDWSNALVLGHNLSGFDALIHGWRFGINPKAWGCTLAMARPIFAKTTGLSLRAVAEELGVGQKLSLEATNTKGKRLADFTPEEVTAMRTYNGVDTDLCYGIFRKLLPYFTKKELKTIDYTIRMLVHPKFICDTQLLSSTLDTVKKEKQQTLIDTAQALGLSSTEEMRKQLASAGKFAAILESFGVDVPMKVSKRTGKETYALAKTDQGLLDLQEHSDERVQAVVAARLDVKSTILETRLQALMDNTVAGRVPMPLHYCGADTTGRWSGFIYNPQNFPRINPKSPKHSDAMRKSLRAPKGKKIIVADQSGIELRVNHFLWKVPSSMQMYQEDVVADLYKAFASQLYGILPEEVTKDQRQVGKISQLGLGYGAAAITFRKVAKIMGGVDLSDEEAARVVKTWRNSYKAIVGGWKSFQSALPDMVYGSKRQIDPWGFCHTEKGAVRLPSGRLIRYPHLRTQDDEGRQQFYYGEGRHKSSIYAGKGVENIVQAISRDIINDNVLEFQKVTGLNPSLLVHDEAVYVVDEKDAGELLGVLQDIMRTSPSWWPEIVLWSEGDMADTYGDAK